MNDDLRAKLVKLAKDKEIPFTPAKIKKMSHNELEQVYNEHTANELEQVNETFANILIVKFDELMKNYKWVRPDSKLGQKLQDRKLFKNDVKTIVSYFTPLLPFLGIVEGGAVIFSEVMNNDTNKNDDTARTSEKGDQQNSNATETNGDNVVDDN